MTKQDIKKFLQAQLEKEKREHSEHLLIRKCLSDLQGKKLTLRAQSKLPDTHRLLRTSRGFEIENTVSGNRHFVCYLTETDMFDLKVFDERNAPHSKGAQNRAEKIDNILSDNTVLESVLNAYAELDNTYRKLNKVINHIEDNLGGSFNIPPHYTILKALEVSTSVYQDIRFKR